MTKISRTIFEKHFPEPEMGRQYNAKQAALKAYPDNVKYGVGMFLDVLDMSESDFEHEEGMTPAEYIYGARLKWRLRDVET